MVNGRLDETVKTWNWTHIAFFKLKVADFLGHGVSSLEDWLIFDCFGSRNGMGFVLIRSVKSLFIYSALLFVLYVFLFLLLFDKLIMVHQPVAFIRPSIIQLCSIGVFLSK